MARPSDSRVERALARVSSGVAWRMTTDWLELTCPLPPEAGDLDDRQALRVNAGLHGSSRLVRRLDDDVPHVRADVALERGEDLGDAVASACLDLAHARHAAHAGPDRLPTAWSARAEDSRDIAARGRAYRARVEQSTGRGRVIVELADLAGYSHDAVRAASALLVGVGAAVPGLGTALLERDGAVIAVCTTPVPTMSERHLARALLAVSAACDACGRELQAIRADTLAATYLRCAPPAHDDSPQTFMEEQSCMQP